MTTPVGAAELPSQRAAWGCLLSLFGVGLAGAAAWLVLAIWLVRAICPPDRVDVVVDVRSVSAGEAVVGLIADGPVGPSTLPWYESLIMPCIVSVAVVPGPPGGPPVLVRDDVDRDGRVHLRVQWREAPRYGVLTWRDDAGDRVCWLVGSGELSPPSPWQQFVGRGRVAIRLPAADRFEVAPPALLDRLGP